MTDKIFLLSTLLTTVISNVSSCDGILKSDNTPLSDRPLCSALDVTTPEEFQNRGHSAHFEQHNNEQSIFLFTSSFIENSFDGLNVIELKSAQIDFDFEDETVDPLDRGGFWARWKIVIIPFDVGFERDFVRAKTRQDLEDLLNLMRNDNRRIEVQLSGPFLKTGCEWGDTDELGTQTLTYSNYGIYDWDFCPEVSRVLGIIYEGDENVNDDFIAWLDISKTNSQFVVEDRGKYKIVFQTVSNIELRR